MEFGKLHLTQDTVAHFDKCMDLLGVCTGCSVIKRIEVPRVKEKEVQNSNPDSRPFKSKLSLAERVAPSSAPSTSFNQQQQAAKQLPKKPKQVASETDKPLSFYFVSTMSPEGNLPLNK